jgi:hypothetical protein
LVGHRFPTATSVSVAGRTAQVRPVGLVKVTDLTELPAPTSQTRAVNADTSAAVASSTWPSGRTSTATQVPSR